MIISSLAILLNNQLIFLLNNKSNGKGYLTVLPMAFLLVTAFNVNANSMIANAIDFGLISPNNITMI